MMTETEYSRKVSAEHRKKYAQFFTPEPIATFMATWLMRTLPDNAHILEPAYGLGVFSRALRKQSPTVTVTGYEIDETIFQYATQNLEADTPTVTLRNDDYLASPWEIYYDGIICNPPYLKFHDYDNGRYIPDVNKHLHTRLNGFTNIYTLFLLKSISQLREGGKLVYIVPSEFMNSDYGVEVKRALLQSGTLRHIVVVDFTKNAFDDAITTACILLCDKGKTSSEVRFSKVENVDDLNTALDVYSSFRTEDIKPEEKWKQYYEGAQASNYHHLVPFSTFAKVSRGIATGANQYFTFNLTKQDNNNLPASCFVPCICHAVDVKSQIFTNDDFQALVQAGRNVFLLNACESETNPNVRAYIRLGEKADIHKRYLTASRSPWYALEKREPSPIWVSVFNREGLRFVRNKAGVYNLTTFHCVYNKSNIETDILFAYLITNVAKEIFLDNSRQYGNGLIKFEPNDLNRGKVVDLRLLSDEEKKFILDAYEKLQNYGSTYQQCVNLLDCFFREKFTCGIVGLEYFWGELQKIKGKGTHSQTIKKTAVHYKQLNFLDLFEQYAFDSITENTMVSEDMSPEYGTGTPHLNLNKNVLISLVKEDNMEQYLDQSAKIYYTGKKFPATVALNKLYYFMPYIKRKGIRDLYLIKIARVGTRKEGQPDNDPNDFRLVFEIEFVKQLFKEYKPVELEIWHTFKDTTMKELLSSHNPAL